MRIFFITVFAAVVLTACGPSSGFHMSSLNPATYISAPVSAASYEMYSWYSPISGWNYAIFESATKISTFAEITDKSDISTGTDEVLARLRGLTPGTKVYWNLQRIKGFSLPDQKTRDKLINATQKARIDIEVIAWPG